MTAAPALFFVLPGGGYEYLAEHEGEPIARWLRDSGFEAEVLSYPLNPHPDPVAFVREAIAEARRQNPGQVLGLIGFSAGAHLAGLAAYSEGGGCDMVLLAYPVVTMGEGTHVGSRLRLLGQDPGQTDIHATSLENLVSADSPPTFIWHTADDPIVSVGPVYRFAASLATHGVDHELHVFRSGEHGLGLARSHIAGTWTDLALTWMKSTMSTR